MKKLLRTIFALTIITFIFAYPKFQTHANESNDLEKRAKDGGVVVYQFKYNYEEIYKLLELTQTEFDDYWKKGFSISDMAKRQGISKQMLEEYFVSFHQKEMEKWREKGLLTDRLYFTQVYQLKEEIYEFIERNPNKK